MEVESLLCSAFSSFFIETKIGSYFGTRFLSDVIPMAEYEKLHESNPWVCVGKLAITDFFNTGTVQGPIGIPDNDTSTQLESTPETAAIMTKTDKTSNFKDQPSVNVLTLSGKRYKVAYDPNMLIADLKAKITDIQGVPVDQQRLIFSGYQLEDCRMVSDYGMVAGCSVHLVLRLRGGAMMHFGLDSNLLDPPFDYDFTNIVADGTVFRRGGFIYNRPRGYRRIAIKVRDRYESNVWLGEAGNRAYESPGEWPVAYHGTARGNTGCIAEDGYRPAKCKRFKFGKGIYTTPSYKCARRYASRFYHDGKQYKLLFQNRVNPDSLIRVTRADTGDAAEYWISRNEMDVRP